MEEFEEFKKEEMKKIKNERRIKERQEKVISHFHLFINQ